MSGPGVVVPAAAVESPHIDWRAVVAGAVVASGISFTLVAFGSAIGLSVTSTAATWRDSSAWLWTLSGIYLIFVALCSFGFGGYVAGRMRARMHPITTEEVEFRDGMHGVVTWGLAIVIGAVIAVAGVTAASRAIAPTTGVAASSVASETIVASELDELFRTDRTLTDADFTYRRAEAGRILLKSSSHAGVSGADRDYLSVLTASITGLAPADADARVNRAIAESKDEIHKGRVAAVLQAFMVGAALVLGLAVSWFAATEGGREREANYIPVWDWSWRRRYS